MIVIGRDKHTCTQHDRRLFLGMRTRAAFTTEIYVQFVSYARWELANVSVMIGT